MLHYDPTAHCISLGFYKGGDLQKYLRKRATPFNAAETINFYLHMFDVLKMLQTGPLTFIHPDIKPANILVRETPNQPNLYVLCDFGEGKFL
jgi:serine/threonine protein kinase